MEYHATRLKKVFHVNKIVTVHYFEYEKNYFFVGESHDFWEFVYVDRGEIEIDMGSERFVLSQGYAAFHQPGEYHNLRANGVVAPNLVVISFVCQSPDMDFFKRRILPFSDAEKQILSAIIRESKQAFSSPLDDTFMFRLKRRKSANFGAEQCISLFLEQLLISLRRSFGGIRTNSTVLKRIGEKDLAASAIAYMQEHICENLSLIQIADAMGVSRTSLKNTFREQVGQGVMRYFAQKKMELAKILIREGNRNISQISAYLGFDSIHLFSRRFKQLTGMTPTEYGKSVKVGFE
ncbi:AraC family transcriptional regulator [Ructibacterium gallinarum]|uniref:Helix-turn-helix transcriptional regulator n=1 Tax=Ructibacterium gallinarum TaxID=2779355 RepID=A0A9D5R879_9FIRM|nr:AraC family transcriptional regulator [Ructibacterium gallinarum]MBE5039685.1 helix-turn-helix transcriptional regulator [Ructibacterium gallinarum]